jgi:hypothetical protein
VNRSKILGLSVLLMCILMALPVALLLFIGKHMTSETKVAEITLDNGIRVEGVLGNAVSDPPYIRAYANGRKFFQCRGADSISFSRSSDTLIVRSTCNYAYEYDRIQKTKIAGTHVIYRAWNLGVYPLPP